ncbi:MAG: lytic murein transglycosylase B [Chromatiales bacterium]|nr:lytic murein transglycosylase B [Chromatiales bacterium]
MIPTPHGRQRATAAFAASIAAAGTLMLGATPAWSLDLARPEVREFLADLVTNDGFDPQYLSNVFAGIESKQGIIDAMSRPAEKVKPWSEYRAIFLTPRRISSGVDFFHTHETELRQIARKTGVPPEIIAAIVGVETFYGTRTGSYRAVDALATLAFDYPPRSKFFRGELRQLFLLARDEQLDVTQLTGSYAGALGPPQFIPSSYRNFSVDGDNDGRRNLLSDWNDIFASVANYFVVHNWQRAQPVAVPARLKPDNTRGNTENELVLRDTVESLSRQGVDFSTDLPAKAPAMLISLAGEEGTEYWVGFQNFYAITRYNRSPMYALAVFQLSEAIAAGVRKSDAAP